MPFLIRLKAKYSGRCRQCSAGIVKGAIIYWDKRGRRAYCEPCAKSVTKTPTAEPTEVRPDQPTSQLSPRAFALVAVLASAALLGLGYLSDRTWLLMLPAALLSAFGVRSGEPKHIDRSYLLATCICLMLAVGSVSRDWIEGGLLDHPPQDPSALCRDGSYSYSAQHRGTCSWHGGVAEWNPEMPPPRWWQRL